MKKHVASLSAIFCLLLAIIVCPCLAQMRRSQTMQRPRGRDFQRHVEQLRLERRKKSEEFKRITDEYENEVYQEVLGADENQWKIIKPKLERIDELRAMPTLRFSVYGVAVSSSGDSSSGGGSSSSSRYGTSSGSGGGSGYGSAGGSAGGSGGGSTGSTRYGSGRGTGSSGGAGHGSASTSGGGAGYSYGFGDRSGGGTGPDRPVKKQVGELNLGWTWHRPSEEKRPEELTEADKTCEQLLDTIEAEKPDHELMKQHVEQLRQIRRKRRRQLEQAQKQLRDVVTPEQEVRLILMGYLDE